MGEIVKFPVLGWAVRGGARCAHFLVWRRGRLESACGSVERLEEYAPQRLRPRQAEKERCQICERELRRAAQA